MIFIAPSAIRKRRGILLRASMRSWVSVDATGNRLSDVYTLELTEFNATNAWKQNFNNGYQYYNYKTSNICVRAVRK